ncbi:MAG TPA: response regulator transcription factor [Acidimicrobiales bacterium]|nr:response regulator transcription factor [Acidimicrobiales bacterium]
MAVRVVLAEDNYLVREGLGKLIDSESDLELVTSCADYDSLLGAVARELPDVVVTDIRMPPSGTDEGIRAARIIRDQHPDIGVVVLSQYSEPAYALSFFDGGSRGRAYLLKERVSDIGQLAGAIREVAAGGSVIDPLVVDALVAARAKPVDSPLHRLTPRETEILSEMAQGKNNAAVAASLVLSERAVEKHINSIFSKLALSEEPDVHRRVKAVLLFLSAQGA